MNKVTLADLSLRDISWENLPRLKELREHHFASRPEICIELPRLMTEYAKIMDNPNENSSAYKYRCFGYFLLMDEAWHKRGLKIGFDLDNT